MNQSRKHFRTTFSQFVALIATCFLTTVIFANPVLDQVTSGQVSIQQSPGSTVINQASDKAIINWQSFNIGSTEATHFQQPAGGIALNRISASQGPSEIFGRLTATGQIILENPAGIFFGSGAYVNVGGLIATTAHINDADFLNGFYHFSGTPVGSSVINAGTIIAAQHGLVALVGANVRNDGMIEASLGKVVLASGNAFTVDFAGDGLINFTLDDRSLHDTNGHAVDGMIVNTGNISVSPQTAQNVLDNSINMQGVEQAQSVSEYRGEIILGGSERGMVKVAGKLDASNRKGGRGGKVTVTGYNILVDDNALIDVSGDFGGGEINIGGDARGIGPLPRANAVVLMPNASLLADSIINGDGGNIVLWSDYVTKAYGKISARGGEYGGNGGLIETSSKNYLDVANLKIDTRAPMGEAGEWLLDPTDVTITNINPTSNNNFAAGTFTPNGNSSNLFIDDLMTNLNVSNVTITTASAGAGTGNIVLDASAPIGGVNPWTAATTLTLNADANITLNAPITNTVGGNLTLIANGVGANGVIDINAPITLTGGSLAGIITNGVLTLTARQSTGFVSTINAITASSTINVNNFQLLQGNWVQNLASLPSFNAYNFGINKSIYAGNNSLSTSQFIRVVSPGNQIVDTYGLQGMGGTTSDQFISDVAWTLPTGGYVLNAAETQHWNYYVATGGADITCGTAGTSCYLGYSPGIFGKASGRGIDGNNGTISNLYIYRPNQDNIGLVGASDFSSGLIQNLILVGANITGRNNVGGFMGGGPGNVVNVTTDSTSIITGTGISIGGIIGNSSGGGFANDTNNATVIGDSWVGGVVGLINISSNVSGLQNNGNVTGRWRVGGVVGYSFGGSVSNSNNTGTITGIASGVNNPLEIGGVIGAMDSGLAFNLTNTGNVSGDVRVGGLIGLNAASLIGNAISTGNVMGAANVGALIGEQSFGTIDSVGNNIYATGTVTVKTASPVAKNNFGGLVGLNSGGIIRNMTISPTGPTPASNLNDPNLALVSSVGGLAGFNSATIQNSSSSITVLGLNSVGGLVGGNSGLLQNVSSASTVNGNTNVGGLVGANSGQINVLTTDSSSATGSVVGTGTNIGGLIGSNSSSNLNGFLSATGSVTGTNGTGGLIGTNSGNLNNPNNNFFVGGNVNGADDSIGGLIGINSGSITAGTLIVGNIDVSGQRSVGGFIGLNAGTINGLGNNFASSARLIRVNGVDLKRGFGFVGTNTANISNMTINTGNMTDASLGGSERVGGLVGDHEGGIISFSTNNININGGQNVGGLIGWGGAGSFDNLVNNGNVNASSNGGGIIGGNFFPVTNSINTGTISAFVASGGLVGVNNSSISSSSSSGLVTGAVNIGGLVGRNTGTITSSFSTGNVVGTFAVIGGLVGYNQGAGAAIIGTIANPTFSTGNVSGNNQVGGFVGVNEGSLSGSIGGTITLYGTGVITATAGGPSIFGGFVGLNSGILSNIIIPITNPNLNVANASIVGGLAGQNTGTINNSTSAINVFGLNNVGGFVGDNFGGTVTSSSTSGAVSGNTSVGGLLGINRDNGLILSNLNTVSSTGNVSGISTIGGLIGTNSSTLDSASNLISASQILSGSNIIGGFVGSNTGTISNFNFTPANITSVNLPSASIVGGIVGQNSGNLTNLILNAPLSVVGGSSVGGLIGQNSGGTLTNLKNFVNVTGNNIVGGLIGSNSASINGYISSASNLYTTGQIFTQGSNPNTFGGMVGANAGTLTNFAATSPVLNTANATIVGGLVGQNTGTINTSYGNTNISGLDIVGGLVGTNSGNITDSYTNGMSVATSGTVGGLIGQNTGGTINRTYASGYVSGTTAGGLVGANTAGTFTNNFYDINATTGLANNSSGTGAASASGQNTDDLMLRTAFTYPGTWSFVSPWGIISGASYPYLRTFYPTAPRAISGVTDTNNIGGGQTIQLAQNGTLINNNFLPGGVIGTVQSGANGSFYFLEQTGTLTDGAAILAYSTGSNKGSAVMLMPGSGGSLANAFIIKDAAHILANTNDVLSNTTFAQANVNTADMLYTITGSDLSLATNKNLVIDDNQANGYLMDGNILMDGGTVIMSGTLKVADGKIIGGSLTGGTFYPGNTNTLDYSLYSTPVTVDLSGAPTLTISGGITKTGGISSIRTYLGGSASDTLIGENANNTWNITNDAGTVNNGVGNVTFSSFENLNGNVSNDAFIFGNSSSVSGVINGGNGGLNTLNYAAYANPVTVDLANNLATATGGITNFNNFIGSVNFDLLIGPNLTNIWNLTTLDGGNVSGFSFANFENLTGGNQNDAFLFADGVGMSGVINGGGGTTNTLDYGAYISPVTINLANQSGTGLSAGFVGINNFIGSPGSDFLIGPNTVNIWNVVAADTGNLNNVSSFTSFENLLGGSDNDTFTFIDTSTVSGVINGGGGAINTLDYSNYTLPVVVDVTNNTATIVFGGFTGINNFIGGSASDRFIDASGLNIWHINSFNAGDVNSVDFFDRFENLIGGSNDDNFMFADGQSISGYIDGQGGSNTADWSAYTSPITVSLLTNAAPGAVGMININNIIGGSVEDNLIGADTPTTWNITNADIGNLNAPATWTSGVPQINFANFENLTGGNTTDTFVLQGGSISGFVNGGAGVNTLIGDNASTSWNITGVNIGSIVSRISAFSNIQNLFGGSGDDLFTFLGNAQITGTINGNFGGVMDPTFAILDRIDYFFASAPISVIMSDLTNGIGQGFNAASLSEANASNLNSSFININSIRGNDRGYLSVPANKAATIQFRTPIIRDGQPHSMTGLIPDPLLFANFLFVFAGPGTVASPIVINPLSIFGNGRYVDNSNNIVNDNNMNFSNFRNLQSSVVPIGQGQLERMTLLIDLVNEEYMSMSMQMLLIQIDAIRNVKLIPNCSGY